MKANKILQAVLLLMLLAFAASIRKIESNSINRNSNSEKAKTILVNKKAIKF